MIKRKLTIVLLLALVLSVPARSQNLYYGYSPLAPDEEEISGLGSGSNSFTEIAIRLNAKDDPVIKNLQGSKLTGVRVWMRTDYKQRTKGWSAITVREGNIDATPIEKTANFKAGWNEVLFDEPIVIGSEDLYVGTRVFELLENPFPYGTWMLASVPGGCYVKSDYSGWRNETSKGTLLLQAIIETESSAFENVAYVGFSNAPLTVAPNRPFDCKLYVHNLSDQPLQTVSFCSTDGEVTNSYDVTFAPAIEAFDGRAIDFELVAPAKEGTAVPLELYPTKFNGSAAGDVLHHVLPLYVLKDSYERIPLVEEFTSQMCENCPFMFYYLDLAMEQFDGPLLYVSHHAGFADDAFTQPVDRDLLYLFPASEPSYNPAVMYDRRVPAGEVSPVMAARVAETEPYTEMLEAVSALPAMADVYVDATTNEAGELCVSVSGSVNRNYYYEDIPVYLSCYIIENNIGTDVYRQKGLVVEGAPADLEERFRHNGVIRHNYCVNSIGDRLQLTEQNDAFVYKVSFDPVKLDSTWKWNNCDVVAFVHLLDKEDRFSNYVLNAGSLKLNGGQTSVKAPLLDFSAGDARFEHYFDLQGRVVENPTSGIVIRNGRKMLIK